MKILRWLLIALSPLLVVLAYLIWQLINPPRHDPVLIEQLTNEYRQENGLQPLERDPYLCSIANERIVEIQSDWSHRGFYEAIRLGYYNDSYDLYGENLTNTKGGSVVALTNFKKSHTHNENLLGDYNLICVAVDGTYVVQIFGKK